MAPQTMEVPMTATSSMDWVALCLCYSDQALSSDRWLSDFRGRKNREEVGINKCSCQPKDLPPSASFHNGMSNDWSDDWDSDISKPIEHEYWSRLTGLVQLP
ncbi:hypothetical protein PENANT_c123G03894 [Penicillium antarcticum]|uniref:Uncharacterized protein n=1 Tax=Penicillium antarcticum TaxID=416450 RepID=A0A1V6PJA0_9EURO|nr:hypothetical protein PENANT_c123G03894 [Penicillium antarcticum]